MKNTQRIILSFVFVLGIAFFTHFFFVQRIENQNRDVASFGERNSSGQIKWEQKVAEELAGTGSVQGSQKLSWHDALVYEYLAGQYSVDIKQGHIQKLELQGQMDGVRFTTKEFIDKFGPKIKNYSQYKINQLDQTTEKVELVDSVGHPAGAFVIQRNDQGRVQSISVQ